jgi:hypothetical protein
MYQLIHGILAVLFGRGIPALSENDEDRREEEKGPETAQK